MLALICSTYCLPPNAVSPLVQHYSWNKRERELYSVSILLCGHKTK